MTDRGRDIRIEVGRMTLPSEPNSAQTVTRIAAIIELCNLLTNPHAIVAKIPLPQSRRCDEFIAENCKASSYRANR
jgi:hypothetical protein